MILLFSVVMLLVAAVLITRLWDDKQPRAEVASLRFDRAPEKVRTPE